MSPAILIEANLIMYFEIIAYCGTKAKKFRLGIFAHFWYNDVSVGTKLYCPMTFETKNLNPWRLMIATLESDSAPNPQQNNSASRVLERYDYQIARIWAVWKERIGQLGMNRKEFLFQAMELRDKVSALGDTVPTGNILIVTCLPYKPMNERVKSLRCGRHSGVCDCNPEKLRTADRIPTTLYALVGVDDGRECRLYGSDGKLNASLDAVFGMVKPRQPLTAWACTDLAFHYPYILLQYGFVTRTLIGRSPTALGVTPNGRLIFGSTGDGNLVEKHNRWGVPSCSVIVTI
jgi:hypothetical protein